MASRQFAHVIPIIALLTLTAFGRQPAAVQSAVTAMNRASVVRDGLTNPRGFTWGADGTIFLALAGSGGTTSSVIALGPGGGCPRVVAAGLPSFLWEDRDWVWGAMDVAVLDGALYVLSAGGDLGVEPNAIDRIEPDGSRTRIADLSAWLRTHPPAFVPPDYNPKGSLFDLEVGDGAFWVSEAVGGRVLKVTSEGTITLFADLSADHPVPTGIAPAPGGRVYVGFETSQPFTDGQSKVVEIAADGTQTDVMTNLTMVTDVTTAPDGTLYVAEMSTGNTDTAPYVRHNSGTILHRLADGTIETVANGLDFPVGLGVGPDGAIFVSGPAYGANHDEGWLARIDAGGATPTAPVVDASACGTPTG